MIFKREKLWVLIVLFLPLPVRGDFFVLEDAGNQHGVRQVSQESPLRDPGTEEFPRGGVWAIAETVSAGYGVSPGLIKSIILTESNGDPRKVSRKGAKGLMQLMPVVVQHYRVSDPYDPVTNIRVGVQYLASLLEEFSGDLPLALAAYNAGPTAVRKYRGIPPFAETRAFVLRVSDLFHSLEPWPRMVHLAMNSGRGEPAAAGFRPASFSGSPRSFSLGLKKMRPESREAQVQ